MKKNTAQRRAIFDAFTQIEHPEVAATIWQLARKVRPNLGLATVYRTINGLIRDGHVRSVELPTEAPRFELADRPHHHQRPRKNSDDPR